jgi:hypothetical protein
MNLTEAKAYLTTLAARFRWTRIVEFKLTALGMGLLFFALARTLVVGLVVPTIVGSVLAITIFILRLYRTGALKWNAMSAAAFLNERFPALRESADLLAEDRPMTGLEQVQQGNVLVSLRQVKGNVKVPHRIPQSVLTLLVGLVALFLLPAAVEQTDRRLREPQPPQVTREDVPPSLTSVRLEIVPPAYTGLKKAELNDAAAKVPAGSRISWKVMFQGSPISPGIRLSAKDSIRLVAKELEHQASARMTERVIYQVTWSDAHGKRYASDYYHIDITEDLPPQIMISDREQFQVIQPGDSMKVEVRMKAADDYAIRDAHLVATVSKGSGESVKFREVTLTFEGAQWPRKHADLTRRIDLTQLGLEPGDELYFYAEAIDNRVPQPNLARTETFFIALQDTSQAVTVADMGLGVDLMPEYFRSQRQIIIDTEKLLAEQRKIKKAEFNSRSNELGFDQKALRLKYGQFLGMEDEAGIGVVAPFMEQPVQEEEEEVDPLKQFGHEHDKENEHNLVDEKKPTAGHQHDEEKVEGEEEDPMKAFVHQHDSEEEATFFTQSVKTKLKTALSLMWDSELQLRMYEPKKSLPFQYRILTLLKEIAQDNRAYVHRTGFDPPPIKEERRLTGDLDEVSQTTERMLVKRDTRFPAIQEALADAEERLQSGSTTINDKTRALAQQAGVEVASEALKQPGKYLGTLSMLRRLADGAIEPEKVQSSLKRLRADFWSILPEETWSPTRGRRTLHPLDREVLRQLKKSGQWSQAGKLKIEN